MLTFPGLCQISCEFDIISVVNVVLCLCVLEVARTRLREEGNIYHGFWQTLRHVWLTEGRAGLYRGLATQLVRQIPNTAIMMSTYEAVVYLCHKHGSHGHHNDDDDDLY